MFERIGVEWVSLHRFYLIPSKSDHTVPQDQETGARSNGNQQANKGNYGQRDSHSSKNGGAIADPSERGRPEHVIKAESGENGNGKGVHIAQSPIGRQTEQR